ncbi:hypothetical protein HYU82_02980 [Candidatus Saccharibacteria bacterium]|nr:hypothetical protein [Candidatus Saccharibacteria bacterium]MBI2285762.1 hypothetical protein [Candidatus Saccharibacteria bacterium]
MEAEKQVPKYEIDEITGERPPINPQTFVIEALRFFAEGAKTMESMLPDSHEVVTQIDGKVTRIRDLSLRVNQRTHKIAKEHKTGLIAAGAVTGLTVAGIIAARRHLRTRKK